jgi:hypothetical protein
MRKVLNNRIGEKFKTNNCGICEIINYYEAKNITIKFEDGTILENQQYNNLKIGKIKNSNTVKTNNIGYFGIGKYNVYHKSSSVWNHMLQRCYSEKEQLTKPTYIGCSVVKEWHNFQVFAEWFENNYIDGFHLDKDILIKGNKIYGPETCCFVPIQINSLFTNGNSNRGKYPVGVRVTLSNRFQVRFNIFSKQKAFGTYDTVIEAFNVYKFEKEKQIKEVAEIWKPKIPEKVYLALINYQVEITD